MPVPPPFPKGHPRYGGRQKGTPKNTRTPTQEFRRTIELLLDDHRDNVDRWLRQVANGTMRVMNGELIGTPPDPAKALDIIAKLAEYGAPKLSRAEVAPAGDGAAQGASIRIEFVHPPAQLPSVTPPNLPAAQVVDTRAEEVTDVQPKESRAEAPAGPPERPQALSRYLDRRNA